MVNFSDSGHPIFRASSAFERGDLRSKEHGKKSIHFNGSDENIELLLRTVISAKQIRVCGAITDFMQRIIRKSQGLGKTWSTSSFGYGGDSYWPFCWRNSDQCTATVKLGARIRAKIRTIVRRLEIIQIMFWCGFEACRNRTILLHSWYTRRTIYATSMPRIHDASKWEEDSCERMDSQEYENRSILEHKSLLSRWSIQYWSSDSISVSRQYRFLGLNREWCWQVRDRVMPTAKEEDMASVKPIAKARPRQKPTVTLTSVSIPVRERQWIDIETQGSHDQKCFEVSKSHCSIATTWSNSPLRKRRSNPVQWHHRRVQEEEVWWCFDLKVRCQLWQKEEELRKDFNITWIQTLPIRKFARQSTVTEKDLPSTSTTWKTRVKWIP